MNHLFAYGYGQDALPNNVKYVNLQVECVSKDMQDIVIFGLEKALRAIPALDARSITSVNERLRSLGVNFPKGAFDAIVKSGGHLPVEVSAPKDGTVVPAKNVALQLVNTDPKFPWAPFFLLSALDFLPLWKEASLPLAIRRACASFSDIGGTPDIIGHAMPHLLHTDIVRISSIPDALLSYQFNGKCKPIHELTMNQILCWEDEEAAIKNFLNVNRSKPYKIVSIDTNNPLATLNFVCGVVDSSTFLTFEKSNDPEACVRFLSTIYRRVCAEEGDYKTVNNCRIVCKLKSINDAKAILTAAKKDGYSSSNFIFDIQHCACDLQLVSQVNGISYLSTDALDWKDVGRNPVASPPTKKGRQALVSENGKVKTIPAKLAQAQNKTNLLVPVWKDGKVLDHDSLEVIQQRFDQQQIL